MTQKSPTNEDASEVIVIWFWDAGITYLPSRWISWWSTSVRLAFWFFCFKLLVCTYKGTSSFMTSALDALVFVQVCNLWRVSDKVPQGRGDVSVQLLSRITPDYSNRMSNLHSLISNSSKYFSLGSRFLLAFFQDDRFDVLFRFCWCHYFFSMFEVGRIVEKISFRALLSCFYLFQAGWTISEERHKHSRAPILFSTCLKSVALLKTSPAELCRHAFTFIQAGRIISLFNFFCQLKAKGKRPRRALIRWKLIAVNSLIQMWQGFEPFKETAYVMNEGCSCTCFVPQCLDALVRSWHAGGCSAWTLVV